jgi:cbb3-type cytochrome oxidase cytochrome c subunit
LVLAASIGLFVFAVAASLLAPALGGADTGPRSSELALSALAIEGRDTYAASGCGSCHTQMVRPVIADVGLGAVTLSDSNQVLGTRRYGPDLSNVGARLSGSQISAIIGGFGGHPAASLESTQAEALVAYLTESKTLETSNE